MPRMIFAQEVKYKRTKYPSGVVVEVDDTDTNVMRAVGGWILEKGSTQPEPQKESKTITKAKVKATEEGA